MKMALSDEQNDRLTLLLQQLEPEIKNMKGSAPGFVRDQIERHDKYGAAMFLSPKQLSWLESLYEQNVGPLRYLEGTSQPELTNSETGKKYAPGSADEDDDSDPIPF
jgi:hypothetical protein